MKAFRSFIATLLILIILGGVGYIGYNTYYLGGMGDMGEIDNSNTPQANQESLNKERALTQSNTQQNTATPNTVAAKNRETLTEAIGLISQAIDLITIDPYSKTTLPDANNGNTKMEGMSGMNGQSLQGNGAINIYPNGNSSVNITPSGNVAVAPKDQTPQVNNNPESMGNMDGMGSTQQSQNNYVYDQGKLEQLHSGIFSLAQGVMSVNQLNEDLFVQSTMVEANPKNYQTYVMQYNMALQNRNKINSAMSMLSQASILINVNPYASQKGYSFNSDGMKQLHEGVYKLAQGMALLNGLNQDFGNQMINASIQVQSISDTSNQLAVNNGTMTTQGTMVSQGIFANMNVTTLFNIILVILLVSLIIGVLGAITNMLSPRNKKNKKIISKIETESDVEQ